jgi:hypothetical protein
MPINFPSTLTLTESPDWLLNDAAVAIRSEYRDSVRWKRLLSRKVTALSDGMHQVEVGHAIEFDWAWEGAVSFRPPNMADFDVKRNLSADEIADAVEGSGGRAWFGDVLEVDQVEGKLVINASESEFALTTGSFYVKPFEFLYYLNLLYNDPSHSRLQKLLPARLKASQGGQHPKFVGKVSPALPELRDIWAYGWAVLWGPPGTGKTATIGKQISTCMADPSERVLIVSTTNTATDEAALSLGTAIGNGLKPGSVLRIGKGARLQRYRERSLETLLMETEVDLLAKISEFQAQLKETRDLQQRALLRRIISDLRRKMQDASKRVFEDASVQVVISTAYNAVRLLADPETSEQIADGRAPFTTIVMDEAGLLSKATVATLSLLSANRVVLVGDPKQLAPISKVSRILPTPQQEWLASSGLSHLRDASEKIAGVHLLREQHRMHPQIGNAISHYQYQRQLENAKEVSTRSESLPDWLKQLPRAVWYVLGEEVGDHPSIRAQRGPGGTSYVREATRLVLDKLFSAPGMRDTTGLFITPFAAQAKDIDRYFHDNKIRGWTSGTVHSQQGVSVDMVVFDTVHAGSTGWPPDEWKRIVNVGLSRARFFAMLIASRSEMQQPFLRPLARLLTPIVQNREQADATFAPVEGLLSAPQPSAEDIERLQHSALLGDQIRARKALRPLMTAQQQRLVNLKMDGGPRLVRGVAGSDKTIVLARWLQQVVCGFPQDSDAQIWVVYANQSLGKLIHSMIDDSWQADHPHEEFGWERVRLVHIQDLLGQLEHEFHVPTPKTQDLLFDYAVRSAEILRCVPADYLSPRCDAMFIDEAQDMGPKTLELLAKMVYVPDSKQAEKRPVHIFYDNAQNLYNRGTPTWSDIGLDMRGRSVIMEESFRSTRPITEFALNMYFSLRPPTLLGEAVLDADNKELVERGLIEQTEVNGMPWWRVRYNSVDGPAPEFKLFESREMLNRGLAHQLKHWLAVEKLRAEDIVVLCNSEYDGQQVVTSAGPMLENLGVTIEYQRGFGLARQPHVIVVTTPHSFKGYDAEIVVVAHAQNYIAKGNVLPSNLYVAMTRARSQLLVCAVKCVPNLPGQAITNALEACFNAIADRRSLDTAPSKLDELHSILDVIGVEHREWLQKLAATGKISQEPIIGPLGEIVAEPAFRLNRYGAEWACFTTPVSARLHNALEDLGMRVFSPGES